MDSTFQRLIARNFEDLLRLVLACGDLAAPAQAHMLSEGRFKEFVTECSSNTRGVLGAIGRSLDIKPMPLPYRYIKEFQDSFDLSAVPYTDEYYEVTGPFLYV